MATLVATQYNPTIRAFDQRLRAAGKAAKVALTACMRKLLTICNAMIKTATPWNLAGPSPTTGPNRQLLRSFRWGQVRQLDRVSRELLARAWSAGAGTGDVLMSRLHQGRANTVRGAAHFLRGTVGRVRYAGASGQLTVRAESGFYTHVIVAICREKRVRFSITVRQHQSLRQLIEAIPEEDWTPIPYWMDGAADVAETKPKPRWDVHLPGAGNRGGSLAGVFRPLIAGPSGSAVSPRLSGWTARPGICRPSPAPPPCCPGTDCQWPPLSPSPR